MLLTNSHAKRYQGRTWNATLLIRALLLFLCLNWMAVFYIENCLMFVIPRPHETLDRQLAISHAPRARYQDVSHASSSMTSSTVVKNDRLLQENSSVSDGTMLQTTTSTMEQSKNDETPRSLSLQAQTTSANQTWNKHYDIVHIVTTRFMQNQPHLVELGRARMALFKSISLPSMRLQMNHDYLWIVRIDPALDKTLQQDLFKAIVTVPNAIVVASNEDGLDFRASFVKDVRVIVAGNRSLAESFWKASRSRPVLETRLDADDALSVHFMESLQALVTQMIPAIDGWNKPTHQEPFWVILCAVSSIEWQLDGRCRGAAATGCLHISATQGGRDDSCITPGLTYVYGLGATPHHVLPMRYKHDKIALATIDCGERPPYGQCLHRLSSHDSNRPDASFGILRARTPTSAGMKDVYQGGKNRPRMSSREDLFHQHTWKKLSDRFGIKQRSLVNTRAAILENLSAIVQDALKGQCTPGHSCKRQAAAILRNILLQHKRH